MTSCGGRALCAAAGTSHPTHTLPLTVRPYPPSTYLLVPCTFGLCQSNVHPNGEPIQRAERRERTSWGMPGRVRNELSVGNKRSAIVLGGVAMERIVAGRYEWRDRAMTPMRGARKRYWEDMHEPTHRAQRPRTDGDTERH